MRRITEQTFYKYLKCPHWVHFELQDRDDVREPLLRKLQDEGLVRERELELLEGRKGMVEVDMEDMDEAAQRTLELMREGISTIYRGVLIDGHWVGRPDVLERVEGTSKLGGWYYVACDIKRSSHLKDEYRLQGVFYGAILEKLQGLRPVQGYVMHINGEVEGYLLDEVFAQFKLTLEEIEDIFEGKEPKFFFTSSCKQSPYFSECQNMARTCDDLSLLNKLWKSEADSLKEAGISTLSSLALASTQQLSQVSGLSFDRAQFLQTQAKALKENKLIKLHSVELPDARDVELVVDIESDPLRDLVYLIGVLEVKGTEQLYHAFQALTPEDVPKMWKEFCAFLQERSQAHLYHYGWYEIDVLRGFVQEYGAPEEVKQQLQKRMVDILPCFRESIVFPLSFYALKDIAKFLGFTWRTADASGLDSVLWFEDFLREKDPLAWKKILEYNEDDVLATWHLIQWARNNT